MARGMTARQLVAVMLDAADKRRDPDEQIGAALRTLIDSGHWFCVLREQGNLPSEQLPLDWE